MNKICVEKLYEEHRKYIENCAYKFCQSYHCKHLRFDLISAGTVAFIENIEKHDKTTGISITAFIKPYILGAMRREIEMLIGCMKIPKRTLDDIRKAHAVYNKYAQLTEGERIKAVANEMSISEEKVKRLFCESVVAISIDEQEESDYDSGYSALIISDESLPHICTYKKINIELLKEVFEELSFKEQQFIGEFFGVFGKRKRTIADIGEDFMIDESGAVKAKDRALRNLAELCKDGKLGLWRWVYWTVMKESNNI